MTAIKNKRSSGSKQFLYEIIRDKIVAGIIAEKPAPGTSIATEEELCKRFNVGRNTVRKAIGDLEKAGYIIRRQKLGVVVTDKLCTSTSAGDRDVNDHSSEEGQVLFVLPQWDNVAGNYFIDEVFNKLNKSSDGKNNKHYELRSYHDTLENVNKHVETVLVVDPDLTLIPRLSELSEEGKQIIAIDPQYPLYMAQNLYSDVYGSAIEAVNFFYKQGHRKMGLINSRLRHAVFQQWLAGFIDGHKALGLPIDPQAIVQAHSGSATPEPDPTHISAWLCTFSSAVDMLARACNQRGLVVPDDVAVIGSDDPGDKELPSIKRTLSIIRPNFSHLEKTIRKLIKTKNYLAKGDIHKIPMAWVSRESEGCKIKDVKNV